MDNKRIQFRPGDKRTPLELDPADSRLDFSHNRYVILDGFKCMEFNLNLDAVGLPIEHPAYASNKCRQCWGKGYITLVDTQVIGTGPLHFRKYEPCTCLNTGYIKLRKMADKMIEDDKNCIT